VRVEKLLADLDQQIDKVMAELDTNDSLDELIADVLFRIQMCWFASMSCR
jgi:hypothetical protein